MAKTSLVTRIIAGLVLGVVVGALLNFFPEYKAWIISSLLQPVGEIFIKMMKMIVVPSYSRAWSARSQAMVIARR